MAQYFYSPRDIPTEQPCPDTTERFVSNYVECWGSSETCNTFQGRAIRLWQKPSASGWFLQSFDMVDGDANRHNCDVLFAFKVYRWGHASALPDMRVYVRASGTAGSPTCYLFNIRLNATPASSELMFYKYNAGSGGALGSSTTKSLAENTVYLCRVRANGTTTTTLYVRIWEYGTTEPGAWDRTYADSSSPLTAAGWIGLNVGNTGTVYDQVAVVDWVSIGTAGNTANNPTLSPATYTAWLADDTQSRCVLAHLTMASGTTGAETIKRISNRAYSSKSDDTPANTPYIDIISRSPRFTAQAGEQLFGRTTVGVGSLFLDNSEGDYDAWALANVDGREALFLLGDESWSELNFRPIQRAVIEQIIPDGNDQLRVDFTSAHRFANSKLLATPDAPKAYGNPFWIEPVCVDDATLKYLATAGTCTAVGSIYDGGRLLFTTGTISSVASSEITTSTAHGLATNWETVFATTAGNIVANTPYYVVNVSASNKFKISDTIGGSVKPLTGAENGTYYANGRSVELSGGAPTGYFYTNSKPTYEFRLYNVGGNGGTSYGNPAHASVGSNVHRAYWVLKSVLEEAGCVGYVDDAAWNNYSADGDLSFSCGVFVSGSENAMDMCDELAETGLWLYNSSRDGLVYFADILVQDSGSGFAIGQDDIIGGLDIVRIVLPASVRNWSDKNWHQSYITDPLATGTDYVWRMRPPVIVRDRAASYATYYDKTTTDAGDDIQYHAGRKPAELRTLGHRQLGALAYWYAGDQYAQLRSVKYAVIKVKTLLPALELNVGDLVTVTYPRYGFDSGKVTQVLGYEDDLSAGTVTLTLLAPEFNQGTVP